MSKTPKFRVKGLGWEAAGTYSIEQARNFPYGQGLVVSVEDQVVQSYEELLQLINQPSFVDKDFIQVTFLDIIVGG